MRRLPGVDMGLAATMVYDAALSRRCAAYGISAGDFCQMYAAQFGCCAICKRKRKYTALVIDHNHITGQVRGLLCRKCNSGLGMFGDDPAALGRAHTYLLDRGDYRESAVSNPNDARFGDPVRMKRYVEELAMCDEIAKSHPEHSQIRDLRIKSSEHRRAHRYMKHLRIPRANCTIGECASLTGGGS